VTDSITVELDRDITFHTLAGDPVPAHAVALVLTGDAKTTRPGARLVFRVASAVYDRILAESLFGLAPGVRGEPAQPFVADRELEIDARLRPDVTDALIASGGGARELAEALAGAGSAMPFIAATESWQALSVVQELDTPDGVAGAIKSGYRAQLETGSMLEVAMSAAERAGTPLEDVGDGLYRFSAGRATVLVAIDEATRICAVYTVAPELVPEPRRAEVAQYLIDRNYYLNVGAFEMDLDDGEVRLRTSIDATHAAFDEAMFVNLVASNLRLFELHDAPLRGLATGTITLAEARRSSP
jgi:hypothetical protein